MTTSVKKHGINFVAYHVSPEFKDISERNSNNRKRNKYEHHMSCSGYTGLEEKLLKEDGKNVTEDSIPPHTLWKKDEMKKSGSVDQWAMISAATRTQEHPGRQRGAALEMTKTDMHLPKTPCKKGKKKSALEIQVEMMAPKTEMMSKELAELQSAGPHSPNPPNPLEVPIVDSANDDPRMSTLPPGLHKCEFLACSPLKVVARGKVVIPDRTTTTQQEMMHSRPLLANQRRVMVDKAEVQDTPVPFHTTEFEVVRHAVASFVPWPINHIRLTSEKETSPKGRVSELKKAVGEKRKTIKSGASATRAPVEMSDPPDVGCTKVKSVEVLLFDLDTILAIGEMVDVQVGVEIVGRNSVAISIGSASRTSTTKKRCPR